MTEAIERVGTDGLAKAFFGDAVIFLVVRPTPRVDVLLRFLPALAEVALLDSMAQLLRIANNILFVFYTFPIFHYF